MATPHSTFFPTLFKFLILYYSLLLVLGLAHHTQADRKNSHTIHTSSFFQQGIVCKPSNASRKGPSTMTIFHRYGPCSPLSKVGTTAMPSPREILTHDRHRVRSIQARLTRDSSANNFTDMKVDIPARPEDSLYGGNYIVTIGLGTPVKTLSLVFDTGSSLTWTQCEPCAGVCYKQEEPIFDPSSSTSYSNVSCGSSECSLLTSAGQSSPCDDGTTCPYSIGYGDGSSSSGWFSKDVLTLTPSDVIPDFLFGCGQDTSNLIAPGASAGILGLGRRPFSLISTTSQKYENYFSYCIPSTPSSTGHLTLGKTGASTGNFVFTPLSSRSSSSYYYLQIIGISVGGSQLAIDEAVFNATPNIIDSGTVITYLPLAAYSAMKEAFQQGMAQYPQVPGDETLDTCYDMSNFTTWSVPTIAFTFAGNVVIDLDPLGRIYIISRKQVCLAFAGNKRADDKLIFGNTQQKTFEVVYDVAGGKLGFGAGGCN